MFYPIAIHSAAVVNNRIGTQAISTHKSVWKPREGRGFHTLTTYYKKPTITT